MCGGALVGDVEVEFCATRAAQNKEAVEPTSNFFMLRGSILAKEHTHRSHGTDFRMRRGLLSSAQKNAKATVNHDKPCDARCSGDLRLHNLKTF